MARAFGCISWLLVVPGILVTGAFAPSPCGRVEVVRSLYTPDFYSDYAHENDLVIPNRVGITTRYWGDPSKGFVSKGNTLSDKQKSRGKFLADDAQDAIKSLVDEGVKFIDTNESYGKGSRPAKRSSEDLLAPALDDLYRMRPLVATGVDCGRFSTNAGKVFKSLRSSLKRMGVEDVELYQAKPPMVGGLNALARGFIEAIDEGYCTRVGAIGLGIGAMKSLQRKLKRRGEFLATNTLEFSLTNRKNQRLLDACRDLGVTPLVFNPLGKKRLATGLYTTSDPRGGKPAGPKPFSFSKLEKLSPLHVVQETVAERVQRRAGLNNDRRRLRGARGRGYEPEPEMSNEVTSAQVAINYVIAKGGVPLVDVYDADTAHEVKMSLGWKLTSDEVDMLDSAADLVFS